jgi:hypothetical protein
MPTEFKSMLGTLDGFQNRVRVVPGYLAKEIKARAKTDDDFYNFELSKFQPIGNTAGATVTGGITALMLDPKLSLDQVMKVFLAANECFEETHAEATWNYLVHLAYFRTSLGKY